MSFLPFVALFLIIGAAYCVPPKSTYLIGGLGQSCFDACYDQGMNCNPKIVTNNSPDIFSQMGINCTANPSSANWNAEDQPSFTPGSECYGWNALPAGVYCNGYNDDTQRICRCDVPDNNQMFFSSAYPGGAVFPVEKPYFAWTLAEGDYGVITHLWLTYGTPTDAGMIIRYYIDGEDEASIVFEPSLAAGVGFFDSTAPWGTEWFGKGANNGGWFNNFRIPFQKSIRVTIEHEDSQAGFYFIIRGATNLPILVGGVTLPTTAKMNLFVTNSTFQPLEVVPLVNVTSGNGVHWMSTLSVNSGTMNFLEGCFHGLANGDTWPGDLLSSGTEDYFDSAWYFDAGEFHLPVSGFTHFSTNNNAIQWSAYRFHDQDPLFFNNGFQFLWKNGDQTDATGLKCIAQSGPAVGSPTASDVLAYAWVYTW